MLCVLLDPYPAENLKANAINSSAIRVEWKAPSVGNVDFYILRAVPEIEMYYVPSGQTWTILNGFKPGSLYNISVETRVSDVFGKASSVANIPTCK